MTFNLTDPTFILCIITIFGFFIQPILNKRAETNKAIREEKIQAFKSLASYDFNTGAMVPEYWVEAFNNVPIIFKDYPEVLRLRSELYQLLMQWNPAPNAGVQISGAHKKLLAEISKILDLNISVPYLEYYIPSYRMEMVHKEAEAMDAIKDIAIKFGEIQKVQAETLKKILDHPEDIK